MANEDRDQKKKRGNKDRDQKKNKNQTGEMGDTGNVEQDKDKGGMFDY